METELALAITADPLEGQVPLTVWFTGTATGLAADIWEWTIDGVAADADGPDITHTFLTPGTHTVTLTATNTTLPLANTTSIEIVAEEEKEPMMTAARITHPHIWNVSKIEGEDNVTSLWDLRNKVRKGDTIRIWGVEGHTYKSGITIDKPDVTVKQWEGSPAQPIITYKETDRPVFTVTADNATFRGLNISSSNWLDCNGAGIQATGSMMSNLQRLTIADCTFAENRATKSGGGAYIERCTGATITNCTFTGNRATKSGGGADFQWCTGATITNCTFTGNRANINGGGADFQWCIGAGATITNCTFTNNTVHYGEGGASYFRGCSPITITNCRFDNPDNIRASSSSAFFNTTCTRGTNIAGGPYLGGNLWLQDPAQNISEWCADADFDGICDEPLTIDGFFSGRNTDHLPLVYGGTVAVASTPAGAQIVLDGVTNGYTTDTPLYLSVGEHNITVKLAGYVTPENKTVTVNAGETTEVFFELKEVCGEIDVSSVPAEARIILDGVDTGRLTNAILKDIPTGEHNVTVKLAGYVTPENKTVNVYADETTEVVFELERECGILNVSSVPERAQIVLDGVEKGETNAVLENIPTGTHNVTVTLKDYVTQINDTVTVEAGKTTEVTFELERECGVLNVSSVPAEARIFLDGVETEWLTNTTLESIPTGDHKVTVRLAGYVTPENKTVTVETGEEAKVFFELERECGVLNVSSVPAEARIVLDGVETEWLTNTTLTDIPTGPHNVTVKLDDYVTPENRTMTVETGEEAKVFFELERECGILNVSSVPEGARIVLDGVETEWLTNTTLESIPTGEHNVTVTLDDYVTQINDTVTVEVGKTTEVTFALERECGILNVSSVPEGARIVLDGVETEWLTNTTLESIPTGEHNVTVRLEGYVTPENRTVTVETGEEAKVFFELERECGVLNVSSVPEGAQIFLDGKETEWLTNATLTDIPTGDHNVTVKLDDYVTPENRTMTVETGETTEVFFALERECGILNVSSVPEGARIVLDGVETEWLLTNTTLESIPTGEHKVTVRLAGYVTPENKTVTVETGEEAKVFFELERECGVLNVSSVPEGAQIFLDGKETEWLTNTTLESIPTGEHNVTVRLEGYVTPENRTVTVETGETTEVFFVLEALPTPTPTSSSSGSGGGHSDLSADSTGKIPAGGSGTLAFRGPAIYEIRVTVGETIQTLLVTVGRTGLPSSVGAPASMVYEYDEVTLYHTTDDAIEGALILFKIPKAWLEENSIDPADVVLCRYHDDAWQPLPTEVRDEDATFWYFSAQSPGFSVFAIGGEPAPVAVKTAEAGAQAGTTEPASPVTETPASPPAETPQPFPTMILLLCGAAVLLIAAVVLWKRR